MRKYKFTTNTKLNLGGGYRWRKDGWENLDHDGIYNPFGFALQAWQLPHRDESFTACFASHILEHIPHFFIEKTICEINRVMKAGGVLRILTPDLKKLARAYVNNEQDAMKLYLQEDGSNIKLDQRLGSGVVFLNFIVSPGFDSFLISSDFSQVISGYAHLYCYDYQMLSGLLDFYGFDRIRACSIEDSEIPDHKLLRKVPYDIDREHSLIIECHKRIYIPFSPEKALLPQCPRRIHLSPKYSFLNTILRFAAFIKNLLSYFHQMFYKPPAKIGRML
jgi:SAM-dependent methyltransferase